MHCSLLWSTWSTVFGTSRNCYGRIAQFCLVFDFYPCRISVQHSNFNHHLRVPSFYVQIVNKIRVLAFLRSNFFICLLFDSPNCTCWRTMASVHIIYYPCLLCNCFDGRLTLAYLEGGLDDTHFNLVPTNDDNQDKRSWWDVVCLCHTRGYFFFVAAVLSISVQCPLDKKTKRQVRIAGRHGLRWPQSLLLVVVVVVISVFC